MKFVKTLLKIFFDALKFILYRWIIELINLIRDSNISKKRGEYYKDLRKRRKRPCAPKCAVIGPDVYKRADPLTMVH